MDRVLCDMFQHLATSSLDRLVTWFDSSQGQRLLAEQTPFVGECARRFHGDTLLWAGCHTALARTVRGCMIRHHFLLDGRTVPAVLDSQEISQFRGELHELPLPNRSLDAVVLHHVLETAPDPRSAIREVARVLAPGGRLLIVTFNPWSLWGLRGVYARVFRDSFSGLRFVSSRRLQDWLAVLGFELQDQVKYLAYELPFMTGNKDARLWRGLRSMVAERRLPLGGVYIISAVKQAAAIRPDWVSSRVRTGKLAPVAYPRLASRRSMECPAGAFACGGRREEAGV